MTTAEDQELEVIETRAMTASGGRSDVESQLDAAHKYPRSVKTFFNRALSLATLSTDVAESCIYSFTRGGKHITGPSIRLAEICSTAWGNLQIGSRIADEEEKNIVAEGVAWDMEANVKTVTQVKRRITNNRGERFNDDMITVTGNAAASIARRNAIFGVVPRCYVSELFDKVRKVAVGDASTLADKRAKVLDRLNKMGATNERVLGALGKKGVEDIGLEELEVLIGYGASIKEGERKIDDVFPIAASAPPAPEEQGRRMSLGKGKKGQVIQDPLPTWAGNEAPKERVPGEDDT